MEFGEYTLDNRNHSEQMSKYPKDRSEKNKPSQGFDGRNLQSPMQTVRTQTKRETSQGPDLLEQRWERISNQLRNRFPEFIVAFGYGSGVIPQEGYNYTREEDLPMVDILMIVRDTCTWNQKNLIKNPSFYRGFDKLRIRFQPMIRDKMLEFLSAGITFHPYIQLIEGVEGKIGIIPLSTFIDDLEKLKYNLVAGRLAKPTKIIWGQQRPEAVDEYRVILDLINRNYERTLAFGRLSFQYKKLVKSPLMDNMILMAMREAVFRDLISLSYLGDIRKMVGAEDRNKVHNIYKGNQGRLEEIYAPHFKKYEELGIGLILQNKSKLIKEGNSGLANLLEKKILTPQQQELLNQQALTQALLHEELFPHERLHLENFSHRKLLYTDLASIVNGPASLAGEFVRSSLKIKNLWMSSRLIISQLNTSPILTNLTYLFQKLRKGILKRK